MNSANRVIQRYRLKDFKAFHDMSKGIPMKPITLIYGPNSSGKSSLIHGWLLAHEASHTENLDVFQTQLAGSSVDLGGFSQYVHLRDSERPVEWEVELNVKDLPKHLMMNEKYPIDLDELEVLIVRVRIRQETDDHGRAIHTSTPKISYFSIQTGNGDDLVTMSRKKEKMSFDTLDYDTDFFANGMSNTVDLFYDHLLDLKDEELTEEEGGELYQNLNARLRNTIDEFLPKYHIKYDGFLPEKMYEWEEKSEEVTLELFMKEDMTTVCDYFFEHYVYPFVEGIGRLVKQQIQQMRYLGPLRTYPERHLAFLHSHDYDTNWHSGGGAAWAKVRDDEQVREQVNLWLGESFMKTKYELKVRQLVGLDQMETSMREAFPAFMNRQQQSQDKHTGGEDLLSQLGKTTTLTDDPSYVIADAPDTSEEWTEMVKQDILTRSKDILRNLIMIDKRTQTEVTHRDVGVGISQTLPIVVEALGSEKKVVAIEQPEIHLHPALQAELADVFIRSMREKENQFMIETHSEHLLLRILKRMKQTARGIGEDGLEITPADVCVIFVKPSETGASVAVEIVLSEEGKFLTPWPGGFFEEGFRERIL